MKSTVVDESLSYYKTNVLFQRILQDFKIKPFVSYYSELIASYNTTVHNILVNKIRPFIDTDF